MQVTDSNTENAEPLFGFTCAVPDDGVTPIGEIEGELSFIAVLIQVEDEAGNVSFSNSVIEWCSSNLCIFAPSLLIKLPR